MKKSILLILSVLLIVAITAGLLAHFVFFGTASSVQNKPIGANVSVTGSNVPAGIKAVTTSAQPPFTLAPLGPTVDISPGGKIQGGPITLRFKLNKRASSQQVLLAVRETASSQWMLMKPSAVSADGWYVDVQTDHLSSWQPRSYDLDQTLKLFKSYFNGLSGDMFTQAEKPICANDSLARQDGYSIDSSAKKTLYWCFGVEGKHRILKVVNRTSYPLEVQHPGLTVEHQDFDLDFAQLARLGSGKTTILYPFEEIDFTLDDLPPGGKALLSTAYSGYAQSLYRLEVGVMSLISVVTLFGADNAGFSMLASKKGFQIVLKYMEALLKAKNCANAMFPVPNGGKVLSGCFEPSEIMEALGWKGLLIAPFMAVGSLFEYFRSELESVIDLIGHNDKYMILVSRVAPQPCPADAGVCLGVRSGDVDGDGRPDQVGVTYLRGTCSYLGCTFTDLTIHVVLATGQRIDYVVPVCSEVVDACQDLTNPQFLGLSDLDGNGADEIVLTYADCVDGCGYWAFELRSGQIKLMPFYGGMESQYGWDGLAGEGGRSFKCTISNGVHTVTILQLSGVPASPQYAEVYQPDGDGGMRYTNRFIVADAATEGLNGVNCPGLSLTS